MIHLMKTATVRQLRTAFPRIESWLAEGESVTITKRKKIVAQLTPPPTPVKPNFAKRFAPKPRSLGPDSHMVDLLLEERGS
jgi:antitoxin (DNA-binding transcriptional repressor) of toxin-antitoxin stability system